MSYYIEHIDLGGKTNRLLISFDIFLTTTNIVPRLFTSAQHIKEADSLLRAIYLQDYIYVLKVCQCMDRYRLEDVMDIKLAGISAVSHHTKNLHGSRIFFHREGNEAQIEINQMDFVNSKEKRIKKMFKLMNVHRNKK